MARKMLSIGRKSRQTSRTQMRNSSEGEIKRGQRSDSNRFHKKEVRARETNEQIKVRREANSLRMKVVRTTEAPEQSEIRKKII